MNITMMGLGTEQPVLTKKCLFINLSNLTMCLFQTKIVDPKDIGLDRVSRPLVHSQLDS